MPGQQLQRDLARSARELKDPRLWMVTLLDVVVSKDLAHAKVWFDVLEVEQAKQAEEVLNHAPVSCGMNLGRGLNYGLRLSLSSSMTIDSPPPGY